MYLFVLRLLGVPFARRGQDRIELDVYQRRDHLHGSARRAPRGVVEIDDHLGCLSVFFFFFGVQRWRRRDGENVPGRLENAE